MSTPGGAATHVLVAVKDLTVAKSRLSGVLSDSARTGLVLSMLRDTLSVVRSVDSVSGITVVTPDDVVARVAREAGADVYPDPSPGIAASRTAEPEHGLNSALGAAAEHVRHVDPAANLLALQADLPALQVHELVAAFAAARSYPRSMIVDHHGTGTAALFSCDPNTPLAPSFGPDSARRHLDSGAYPLDGNWPGLRTDVDTESDITVATALGVGPATGQVLSALATPGPRLE
ncbi:MAG: 2-phospho-L-lactate guanylyltransferase [Rhodococcus sp.]|nr:2-phospho-L-lactate guanylyltransferase [Rhodococcus sp. (in: high G+C Gram-positive bacteria)]